MKSDQAPPRRDGQLTSTSDPAGSGPRQIIEQAASDVAHGLKDTDRHGIPSEVPGPGAERPQEAEVPPRGVSRKNYGERQLGRKGTGR